MLDFVLPRKAIDHRPGLLNRPQKGTTSIMPIWNRAIPHILR